MGRIINLERTIIFVFHFFLSLLEQIFRLVEMSFRNHLLLYMAIVDVSCRDKLLMQNFIPANINLFSG